MPARAGALRLATRGSALALTQSRLVASTLGRAETGLEVELVTVRTAGDEHPAAARSSDPGDKSRFVKEIEEALLAGDADLAVHSAKDVPAELPDGLAIVGVPPRADARDALCGTDSLSALLPGARVGTSSLRRRAQLMAARDDLDVLELRGNVDTRLRRLAEGDFDAVVVALAGLERLGRDEGAPLPTEAMTPAPGQGCLALEARADDARVADLAAEVTDHAALVRLTAERAVTTALGASCRTPIGVHATLGVDGAHTLSIATFVGLPDGGAWVRDRVEGDPEAPSELGREAARRLKLAGGEEILAAVSA